MVTPKKRIWKFDTELDACVFFEALKGTWSDKWRNIRILATAEQGEQFVTGWFSHLDSDNGLFGQKNIYLSAILVAHLKVCLERVTDKRLKKIIKKLNRGKVGDGIHIWEK